MTPPRQHPAGNKPQGLERPHGIIEDLRPLSKRRSSTLAVQIIGVALSLALLVWASSLALTPENRESLERLTEAPPLTVTILVILALAGVAFNGAIFQIILGHTRHLSMLHVIAVTGIATLVSYAPFKLSLVVRTLIHRRADHLTYGTLIAWFSAVAGLSMLIVLPATFMSLWNPTFDAVWVLGAIALPAAALIAAAPIAKRVARTPSLHAVTLGSAEYATNPRRIAWLALLRYADLAAMALRFHLAAQILGIALTPTEAIVAASVYFISGIITPSGNLGAREGAVAGIGFLPSVGNHEQLALIALTVTAVEVVAALLAGGLGAFIVRPDRLFRTAPSYSESSNEISFSDDVPDR